MKRLQTLYESLSGEPTSMEKQGPASRMMLIVLSLLGAALCSAIFGFAVGTAGVGLLVPNLVKVPMVVVLSGLFALPTAILALRFVGSPIGATELWASQATATLAASLVLASTAPIVGLFYHSSAHLGGVIAVAVSILAVGCGLLVFARAIKARAKSARLGLVPATALIVLHLIAALQLTGLASPILPEVTPFSQGVDGFIGGRR